jgi:DNA-binding GntR family transcriptional regulator
MNASLAPAAQRPDRNAIADWTLARLHEMVFNGELAPGDVLTEMDLTERLGVSRSPVRDALKELEHSGLVDVDPVNGRRTLRLFGEVEIAESYDVRCELEALAVRYTARMADETAIQRLSDGYDAMVGAILEPLDVWLPIDFAFHAAVAAASGGHRLPYMLAGLWLQHQAFLRRMDRGGVDPSTREQRLETLPKHERILAAIRARDEAEGDRAVRDLLAVRRDVMLVKFREMGLGTV